MIVEKFDSFDSQKKENEMLVDFVNFLLDFLDPDAKIDSCEEHSEEISKNSSDYSYSSEDFKKLLKEKFDVVIK